MVMWGLKSRFFLLIDKDNFLLFYSGWGLLTEVPSFGIFEIFVVVCSMRFLEACTKAKVWEFDMSL